MPEDVNDGKSKEVVLMRSEATLLTVCLPCGEGSVAVHRNMVDTHSGNPVVVVEIASGIGDIDYTWEADDPFRKALRITGRPTQHRRDEEKTVRMLRLHDSGDHTQCPRECRTGAMP